MRIFVPLDVQIVGRRRAERAVLDDFAHGSKGGIVFAPGHSIEGKAIVVDATDADLRTYVFECESKGDAKLAVSAQLLDRDIWTHVDVWASPDGDPVMDLPLSSTFPGYYSRRMHPGNANELQRCEIIDPEGRSVGTVVYVAIKRRDGRGTEYGWKPLTSSNRRASLTSKSEAIAKLPHFAV